MSDSAVDICELRELWNGELLRVGGRPPSLALSIARMADRFRDAGLPCADPVQLAARWARMDGDRDAATRLALFVEGLSLRGPMAAVSLLVARLGQERAVELGVMAVAENGAQLTATGLRCHVRRLEELARLWLAGLSAPIRGETRSESSRQLQHLDYALTLARLKAVEAEGIARQKYLRAASEFIHEEARA